LDAISSLGKLLIKFHIWIGYLALIDPFSYVMEISRAAILGTHEYLPFWASFAALWGFTLVLGYIAIKRLKTILDCL